MDRSFCDLTPEFFQQLVQDSEPGVVVHSVEVTTGSGRGDNYTSTLYRVRAKGSSSDKTPWTSSFICKCLPHNRARREAFKSDALFLNEVAFYTRVLPALLDFQAARGHAELFGEVPRVYLARSDLLVLEDLKERRFLMADRKKGLDVDHCRAVVKALAKLHGVTLAMKILEPEQFSSQVSRVVTECLFRPDNAVWYRDYYRSAARNAVAFVREVLVEPGERTRYLLPLESFLDDGFFGRMVQLVQPLEPMSVLCHGDCWTNNILFNYTDTGAISKVSFIDFQLARYGSPALDLVNVLYCCTSRQLRASHMAQLLAEYCQVLSEVLTELGCREDRLREDQLLDTVQSEVHRCGKFGLGLAIDMIPISTCESEQAPDLYDSVPDGGEPSLGEVEGGREGEGEQPVWTSSETCRSRMTELVRELVDNGDL